MKGVMVPRMEPESLRDCNTLYEVGICCECSHANHRMKLCPFREKFMRGQDWRDMR